ncbi:hypothetical protein NHF50_08150 [Flavobacterium sp. NRK F10]|uniref:hypothetical protein n=1 Tax=Flavobacterium sp. NRK F10 TaxID=2954931 RepID=UPI002091A35B|nr:hypothetical protein [Flavobacterium sp. NRK F10]MCO6175017.1 hypothetical protein [Flavobacterium sp. NRK F10]
MKKLVKNLLGIALLSMAIFTTSCSNDSSSSNDNTSSFVLVQNDLKGNINDGEVILQSGLTYKLTGKLIVNSGATLTIKEGAIIEATDPTEASPAIRYIAVAQGGQIFVEGTSTNPVVMTADTHNPGAWGGLVICGKAPINKGATASAEVSDLTYGGTIANDDSGSIEYLRIEYSGYAYNSEKEFNGLSLFGVGSNTTIDYVQLFDGSDDGIEFFGGTVTANHMVVLNTSTVTVGDDMFDWTEGWTGGGNYWYGKRTNGGNRGIEADNNSNNHLATPIANPTINNLTLISSGTSSGNEDQAFKLRVGTKANINNVVLAGWTKGFDVQHDETISYVEDGTLTVTNVLFNNVGTFASYKDTAGNSVTPSQEVYTTSASATGAGNGETLPTWAQGWTTGF